MLTMEEFERYKTRLQEARKELQAQEAKKVGVIEHLRLTYGLTPEGAKEELERLCNEIPQKEAEFEQKYREFNAKWAETCEES